ncbi:hypothetical protein LXL04_038620 [Taraxacum kok-saghyz]
MLQMKEFNFPSLKSKNSIQSSFFVLTKTEGHTSGNTAATTPLQLRRSDRARKSRNKCEDMEFKILLVFYAKTTYLLKTAAKKQYGNLQIPRAFLISPDEAATFCKPIFNKGLHLTSFWCPLTVAFGNIIAGFVLKGSELQREMEITSLAQTARDLFTFSIESDFPVPGHPQTYKLPAFSCSTHCLQNSTIRFCSTSRHTGMDGAVDTCKASFTALNCSESTYKKLNLQSDNFIYNKRTNEHKFHKSYYELCNSTMNKGKSR